MVPPQLSDIHGTSSEAAELSARDFDGFFAVLTDIANSGLNSESVRDSATRVLIQALRDDALVIGDVELSSGRLAQYYVDGKRAVLARRASLAAAILIAHHARELGATAVGGLTIGADPLACATLVLGPGLKAFLVRKTKKKHGLERWIEGPEMRPGERCLIVDDVVTSGRSVIDAIERAQADGLVVVGVVTVLDRLAGGAKAISDAAHGAPFIPLTTIDHVYPERPDRA
jgi:orotate phosphoribosyltransferase